MDLGETEALKLLIVAFSVFKKKYPTDLLKFHSTEALLHGPEDLRVFLRLSCQENIRRRKEQQQITSLVG